MLINANLFLPSFKRDGAEEKSKASITIYRSMVSNATNTVCIFVKLQDLL